MTDERIPLAGVIGSPVAHSRSPRLHRHWLGRYGIAGYYVPMDVAQGDLADALRTLPKLGFVGVNITIPHKVTVLGLADLVSDRASLIGAANTLNFQADGKVYADNTDGHGFLENMRAQAPDWRPDTGPATVLGAGGAARAVISSLLGAGVREIRLANRTRARSDALRGEFGNRVTVHDWNHLDEALSGAATVVNATSLGMTGRPDLHLPLEALSPDAVVCDLVYTPLQTAFLIDAQDRGCTVVDGLGMLLHQAAPGFERWFNRRPEVDEATRRAVLGP